MQKNNKQTFFSVRRFEQQFEEGYASFKRGVWGLGPYPNNTMKQKQWIAGWDRAYFENLDQIKNV